MADDLAAYRTLREENTALRERVDALQKGDGGGTSDGMEARVAKLEAHMEHVRADLGKLSEVPEKLATLTANVNHLPSKGFVVTAAVSTIAGVVALIGLLQKLGFLT